MVLTGLLIGLGLAAAFIVAAAAWVMLTGTLPERKSSVDRRARIAAAMQAMPQDIHPVIRHQRALEQLAEEDAAQL